MSTVPQHIGFIMDGNRRWAKANGRPANDGHIAGQEVLRNVSRYAFEQGVRVVSAYVFSTENWKRAKSEVVFLMALFSRAVEKYLEEFHEGGIRFIVVGSREGLSKKVQSVIERAEEVTRNNTKGSLVICFNYGGQEEIADAVRKIVASHVDPSEITVDTISDNIYSPDIPPLDLIVRTSGEQRLSNFMLWRAAYSELMFVDKNWPDMTKQDVSVILGEYSRRQRRFGK